MKKLRKEDIDPKIYELYDAYAHNLIDRRQFIERLSLFAVGGITVTALLGFLMPNYASGAASLHTDPRLASEMLNFPSPKGGGEMRALLSKPIGSDALLPGILVVHENRGLNPYIEEVARRAALSGYVSLAPDALSPLGGYPGNDDEGRAMQATRDRDEILEDFIAAYHFLRSHPACNGDVGVVGFCFGGWVANMMAARVPSLRAAVPFYGSQAPIEEVPAINAPLQLHFAEHDARVNAGRDAYEAALDAEGKEYTSYLYEGVQHGFHNHSTPRYDKVAAEVAWKRCMAFFGEHLRP